MLWTVSDAVSTVTARAGRQDAPNIVLLISDDGDYEHFGFMGSRIARTPALDRLAESGTVFPRTYVPAPLCRPSLASLLSGRLPHQHGIYSNYLERDGISNPSGGLDTITLDPTNSLPNRLKAAGYATYATAKFWEGDARRMGFTDGTVKITYQEFGRFVREGQDELFSFVDTQQKNNKPMFIWWAPMLPHRPHTPPARLLDLFKDVAIPLPSHLPAERAAAYVEAMRTFYAMGTWFDEGVGSLVEKLRQAGELENTVFLFYIDNGETIGYLSKNSPYEKGVRTPMFVSWPRHVPSRTRIDNLHYALDLHATILDYAGVPPTPGSTSRSLRPLIEGRSKEPSHDTIFGGVFAHHAYRYTGEQPRSAERDLFAIYGRADRWKFVLYTQDVGPQNQSYVGIPLRLVDMPTRKACDMELYDLQTDPDEQRNLANDPAHRQRLATFRRQALGWWENTGGKPLTPPRGSGSNARCILRPSGSVPRD
jgi:uncharacterized sulfatase